MLLLMAREKSNALGSSRNNLTGRRPETLHRMDVTSHRLATAMNKSETGDLDCALEAPHLINPVHRPDRQGRQCSRTVDRHRRKLNANMEVLAGGPDEQRPAQVFAGKQLQVTIGEGRPAAGASGSDGRICFRQ